MLAQVSLSTMPAKLNVYVGAGVGGYNVKNDVVPLGMNAGGVYTT
jgi:hypothetical protein